MLVLYISKLEKRRGGIGRSRIPPAAIYKALGAKQKKTRTHGAPPFRRHLFASDIDIVIVLAIVIVIVLVTLFPLSSSLIY